MCAICALHAVPVPSRQVAETCYMFYASTPSKLSGENYHFSSDVSRHCRERGVMREQES